jgi:hypothetical protein
MCLQNADPVRPLRSFGLEVISDSPGLELAAADLPLAGLASGGVLNLSDVFKQSTRNHTAS